jgi:hypothetical protein
MTTGGEMPLPPFRIRETWGQTSAGVARVRVVLADGSRRDATLLQHRWFVFTQDSRRPAPIALLGYDSRNRLIARNREGMFAGVAPPTSARRILTQ